MMEQQEEIVDNLQVMRNSLQPTLDVNKKRDPAVIRNRKNTSRDREINVNDRKFSFFVPQNLGGNNTPNLHLRGAPVMPSLD
jgi:hypothetical protein